MTDAADEIVMYLVLRSDLQLPPGKLAAQAGHAVQLAMRLVEREGDGDARDALARWESGSYAKVALRVGGETELDKVHARLRDAGILCARVVDEGRTVIQAGTCTALGVQPAARSAVSPLLRRLQLY